MVRPFRPRYDSIVPKDDSGDWARLCRIEAAWTSHAPTRALLLSLAAEFETPTSAEPVDAKKAEPEPLATLRSPREVPFGAPPAQHAAKSGRAAVRKACE